MRSRTYLATVGLTAAALMAGPFVGPASAADTTVTVTPAHPHGFSSAPDTRGDAVVALTADPAEPGPFGPGYLEMDTANDNNSKATFFSADPDVAGKSLSSLTAVRYQVYRSDTSPNTNAGANLLRPSVQLPLYRDAGDTSGPGGSNGSFDTLVLEPQYCYDDLADNTWQQIDGDHQSGGLGCYHLSRSPDTYYKTLAAVKTAYPNAVLLAYGFDLGSFQAGTNSRVDDLELTFGAGNTQTYDFEAADRTPPPPPLTARIGDANVAEGDSGTTDANFTVTLNRASGTPTVVHYATNDGSAASPSDYTATSGDLVIPAGQTTGTVTVKVNGDTQVESAEVFHVTITSTDADVSAGPYYASGTIVNDDSTPPPPTKPTLSIGDTSTKEGSSGTHAANFTVRLSKPATGAVTVRYTTGNGTATTPSDYVTKTGTLTIARGRTTGVVSVQVKGDRTREGTESFSVLLYSPSSNATIADAMGRGLIVNDD